MKKLIALSLTIALAASALVGCGAKAEAPAASTEGGVITLAASPTPHAIILEHVKDQLKEQGWDLQITEFEDYVQPNNVVESGEITANYFQHIPYLKDFNAEHGTHLVSVAQLHYEPFGIYPGVSNDLSNIKDGAEIAVPNDTTNEARALQLLEANGILKLKEGVGLEATVKDIEENPYNVNIVELEAAQVSRVVNEADFVVLNGNYAMEAGYSVGKDALAAEDPNSEAAQTFANILVVKEGNENDPGVKALIDALSTDEVRTWINEEFDGSVVPLF